MALLNSLMFAKGARGSVGEYTLKKTKMGTVASKKIVNDTKSAAYKMTTAQAAQRMQWGNLVNLYRAFGGSLREAFQHKGSMSDVNAFMQRNLGRSPVYLQKGMVLQGAAVVSNYIISEGTLTPIETTATGNKYRTNISLGSGFSITSATTLAQFSQAVINNNPGYNHGDQISYFSVLQKSLNGTPMVVVNRYEVTLDAYDTTTKLYDIAAPYGFSVVDNCLGHSAAPAAGAFAWVHSRRANKLYVSSQSLISTNGNILAQYNNESALAAAVASYGGYKTDVFLTPNPNTPGSNVNAEQGNEVTPVTASPSGAFTLSNGSTTVTNSTPSSPRPTLTEGSVTLQVPGTNMTHAASAILNVGGSNVVLAKDTASTTDTLAVFSGNVSAGDLHSVSCNGSTLKTFRTTSSGGGDDDPLQD